MLRKTMTVGHPHQATTPKLGWLNIQILNPKNKPWPLLKFEQSTVLPLICPLISVCAKNEHTQLSPGLRPLCKKRILHGVEEMATPLHMILSFWSPYASVKTLQSYQTWFHSLGGHCAFFA